MGDFQKPCFPVIATARNRGGKQSGLQIFNGLLRHFVPTNDVFRSSLRFKKQPCNFSLAIECQQ
jgi:hypothetical protein